MKYPFTQGGFVQLQQALHALTNAQLLLEASTIRHDFSDWILSHFTLNTQQQHFLENLPPSSLDLFAAETAFAVQYRLPVVLHKPTTDDDDDDDDEQGKIIWNSSSLSAKAGPQGFEASGQLDIHISYTNA